MPTVARAGGKAESQELNPSLQHECQEPNSMSHLLPPAKVHTSRKLKPSAGMGGDALMWAGHTSKWLLNHTPDTCPMVFILMFKPTLHFTHFPVDCLRCVCGGCLWVCAPAPAPLQGRLSLSPPLRGFCTSVNKQQSTFLPWEQCWF